MVHRSLSSVMCSQGFQEKLQKTADDFFPEALETSSDHPRYWDYHHMIARELLPRSKWKIRSKLNLVMSEIGREQTPWLSERRQLWSIFHGNRIQMIGFQFFRITRGKEVILNCIWSIFTVVDDENSWNPREAIEQRDCRHSGSGIFSVGGHVFHIVWQI